ncbi:MAG: response regulator [Pyrinomonadaceae bacterium]|nr:response regulator [Pyrinomonadaceae bacterium]
MPNRKLLLADDSVTIQKVVNLTFADEGIDVITFGDGDSALAALRDVRPDIVLADVNMPGASGYRICEAIRSAPDTRHIPVVLLVGSFEPFDEGEAGRAGADGHMTKPFQSIRQLVTRVHELIGPPAETEPARDTLPAEETIPQFEAIPGKPPERTDDIESLYQQSVTGSPTPQASSFDVGDQGLDDEMIETSYTGAGQETPAYGYQTASEGATPADETEGVDSQSWNTEPSFSTPAWEQEQPVSESELPAWDSEQASTSSSWGPEQPPPAERAPFCEPEQPPPVWREEEVVPTSDQYAFEERAAETHAEPSQLEDARTQIFNFQESEPASSSAPESYIGQETVAFDREAIELPEPEPTPKYTDVELLDLPPADSNQTLELTTPKRAELMGSDKRAVSISPELMELIVQKVVERLSQKY